MTEKAKTEGCGLAEKIKAEAGGRESEGVPRRADKVYLESLGNGRGEAEKWAAWVPGFETRVWFRRLKIGAIPHLKGLKAKRHKHLGSWERTQRKICWLVNAVKESKMQCIFGKSAFSPGSCGWKWWVKLMP